MLSFHPDSRLCIDQLVLCLKQVLFRPLRLFKRRRLNAVEMVVSLSCLLREGDGGALPVNRGISLNQGPHCLVNQVAVEPAEDSAATNNGTGQYIDRSDAAVSDGAEVRGVLFIHLHLARDCKDARDGPHLDGSKRDAGTLLILARNLYGVAAPHTALCALLRGSAVR
jgi:hypothetical protein